MTKLLTQQEEQEILSAVGDRFLELACVRKDEWTGFQETSSLEYIKKLVEEINQQPENVIRGKLLLVTVYVCRGLYDLTIECQQVNGKDGSCLRELVDQYTIGQLSGHEEKGANVIFVGFVNGNLIAHSIVKGAWLIEGEGISFSDCKREKDLEQSQRWFWWDKETRF